ncbi:MAG: NAD(P)-dependent oxidoreductase [Planctomycetes bacterium]|nr:NAD(P)-dependent oxidoreductase [Planctomycetota bacterium]
MRCVLITGGTGCIGAATVHALLQLGAERVVVASRSASVGLLRLWFRETLDPRIGLVRGDVGDARDVERLVRDADPTHVIHLGALQTPDCESDHARGMAVNVGGTLHLLDACVAHAKRLARFVFASSAAVYGLRARYPGPVVRESDPLAPVNLYGTWKLASEELVRLSHERHGVDAISLRLNTTYGKGRDRGKTAGVTRAMKAIALGSARGAVIPHRMAYGGRENYHYVEDVGAAFARAALMPFTGHAAFNLRGTTIPVADFLARIADVAGSLGLTRSVDLGIAPDAPVNPFVCDLDEARIVEAFPGMPRTPIDDGIRATLETFVAMAKAGELRLDPV